MAVSKGHVVGCTTESGRTFEVQIRAVSSVHAADLIREQLSDLGVDQASGQVDYVSVTYAASLPQKQWIKDAPKLCNLVYDALGV